VDFTVEVLYSTVSRRAQYDKLVQSSECNVVVAADIHCTDTVIKGATTYLETGQYGDWFNTDMMTMYTVIL
jgi:hypothetical protein